VQRLLRPLPSQEPAAQLLRQTARQQWRLLALNLGSSVLEASTEGATLAVVFLAVEVLSAPSAIGFDWANNPLVSWWPEAAAWLSSLDTTTLFLCLLALAVLLQALQSLSRFLGQVSVGYFAARCRALVTARIHSQVLSFSYPCASGYRIGDLTDYAAQGPEAIRIQIDLLGNLVVSLLMAATYLAVLVRISPWLLVAVGLLAMVITLVQRRLLPRIRAGANVVSGTQVEISTKITEDFQGLRLLHSTGQLDSADKQLQNRMGVLEQQLRSQARWLAVVVPFSSFLPILAILVIVGLSLLFLGGRSTGILPSLVTFVLALQRLNMRLSGLADTTNRLASNSGRMQRLNQILEPQGKQFHRVDGRGFSRLKREIRFDGVSLQYASCQKEAISNISFTLPKGQMLALVGPSGAGKSSIADLLTGLYEPTSGRIWIDNTALDELELASWQRRLGVVSQDTFLFNATIAENISLGVTGATHSEIEKACEDAQAASFIEKLPNGYSTPIGERGYRLSGGQRQRLSLARAILRKAELLILDEATSSLDSESERLVHESIERHEGDRTIMIIAHRLSTIVNANKILVLDAGRIVQQGTHSDLLKEHGPYSQLWKHQALIPDAHNRQKK
jgi:ATP-binding cassette, subfamily B, bacterial MsbA